MLAVTLLAFGIGVYALSSHTQRHDIDASLRQRAEHECPPPPADYQPRYPPPDAAGGSGTGRPVRFVNLCGGLRFGIDAAAAGGSVAPIVEFQLNDPAIYEQVVDGKGNVYLRSKNLGDQTIPMPKDLSRTYLETEHIAKGGQKGDLRVLVWPVPSAYTDVLRAIVAASPQQSRQGAPAAAAPGGGPAAAASPAAAPPSLLTYQPPLAFVFARSLNDVNNGMSRLELAIVIGALICIATAAGAGWLLARNALLPMDRLTAEAQQIGRREDFTRRVRHSGPSDEVGRLAATFNTMLDSLEGAFDRQQRALEAQKRFVADASHELRTPLTTIRGNVDLLRLDDAALTLDQREALDDVASEAERMSRLVANLLELARADGGLRIRRTPIAVQPVIDEVLARSQRRAGGVALAAEGSAAVTVLADRDYLVQLLTILIDNALKYTPTGGAVLLRTAFAAGRLSIAVSDTGPGIAAEHQAQVFGRFYRADPSRHGEGTGLGLAIARWIARELDGEITLQSAPGAGATFTVLLPASGNDAAVPEPVAADAITV